MTNVVEVLDSMMGTSKSTNVLKWIDDNPQGSYIFVSPLLSEVDEGGRIHKALNKVVFEVPVSDVGNKSTHFLELLEDGENIACTHSLYLCMTDRHFEAMEKHNYTVIIDEEIDIIGNFDKYSSADLEWLIVNNEVEISPTDGMVSWVGDRSLIIPSHKYYTLLNYCDSKSLYSSTRSKTMMVTQLPVKLFECAKRVIILTYMFEGNVLDSFLKLKGFEVKKFTEVELVNKSKESVKELITLIPPDKNLYNYSLSTSWYKNRATAKEISDVNNYIRRICRGSGFTAREVAWCVPKERAVKSYNVTNIVKPVGFTYDDEGKHCHLSATIRATNSYSHKKVMVHCYDRHPHVSVAAYLNDYGCGIDKDVFALSELLQWSWRGCIRNDEPMTLAIGSKRMYNLFKDWLEN